MRAGRGLGKVRRGGARKGLWILGLKKWGAPDFALWSLGLRGSRDSGILLVRCAEVARAAGALGTRRKQAARGGAVPGLGAALQSGKREGSRQGGAGSSGERRAVWGSLGAWGRGVVRRQSRSGPRGEAAGRGGAVIGQALGEGSCSEVSSSRKLPLASFSLSRTTSRTSVLAHHGCSR